MKSFLQFLRESLYTQTDPSQTMRGVDLYDLGLSDKRAVTSKNKPQVKPTISFEPGLSWKEIHAEMDARPSGLNKTLVGSGEAIAPNKTLVGSGEYAAPNKTLVGSGESIAPNKTLVGQSVNNRTLVGNPGLSVNNRTLVGSEIPKPTTNSKPTPGPIVTTTVNQTARNILNRPMNFGSIGSVAVGVGAPIVGEILGKTIAKNVTEPLLNKAFPTGGSYDVKDEKLISNKSNEVNTSYGSNSWLDPDSWGKDTSRIGPNNLYKPPQSPKN